jgi:hypothetical protein
MGNLLTYGMISGFLPQCLSGFNLQFMCFPIDAKASALIDAKTNGWNSPLIQKVFWPEEVKSICGMVLSPMGQPDFLVWRGSTNGVFTVKSAYHIENNKQLCSRGESSVFSQGCWVWQKLWRLHVPAVVKTFLWRVCHNSLSKRDNLHKKKITMDPMCPICGLFPETIVHVV